jgi:phosphoribosylglycinamide formyltransferase-1
MKKIAILISNSGTGTNLQAIIDATHNKQLNASIAVVISDTEKAKGVERAKQANIPVVITAKQTNLVTLLTKDFPVDFICLCGWKKIIPDTFIDAFPNKILNLHPGLIPDTIDSVSINPDGTNGLWNKGKLTNVAIQNFLNNHATYAGSSIHYLTHEFDFGPVLGRTYEKVQVNDSIESLYRRLKKKENKLYVHVLEQLCN